MCLFCSYVLQDVTARTLVLVDELGKGTEARAGTALAGAMLEALDAVGCKASQRPPLSAVVTTPWFCFQTRSHSIVGCTHLHSDATFLLAPCSTGHFCDAPAPAAHFAAAHAATAAVVHGNAAHWRYVVLEVQVQGRPCLLIKLSVASADGKLVPTKRMIPGTSTDSLALEVAEVRSAAACLCVQPGEYPSYLISYVVGMPPAA